MSVDGDGAPGYPTAAPWAQWIDEVMRCAVAGRHGRCQLVRGHEQPHAVVLLVAAGKRAWRWHVVAVPVEVAVELTAMPAVELPVELPVQADVGAGWLDDGGPWGNVATDRAPWIPGWP